MMLASAQLPSRPFRPPTRALLACLLAGVLGSMWAASPVAAAPEEDSEMQQYLSGEHVLGFRPGGYVMSNGRYALAVDLLGANAVSPTSTRAFSPAGEDAAPLGRVSYEGVYDGITLHYDAVEGGIARSTWLLEAGASPEDIRLRYNRPLHVRADGSLTLRFETGELTESAPIAWQERDGRREPVAVSFEALDERTLGFTLGNYDRSRPLVIDPVLQWSTFLGGTADDHGLSVAVDGSGNVYVAGFSTGSWGSPVRAFSSGTDAYVAKLDASGSLQWSTFLGGSGEEEGNGVALDGSGNVYVVGWSSASWGSPVRAFTAIFDTFAAKLDASGSLQWNTFLGGSMDDFGNGVAADDSGNVFVVGQSNASWGSPVRAFTSDPDGFAAKLDDSGSLLWNTFLGSTSDDACSDVAVDGGGTVYVAGSSGASWGSPVRAFSTGFDAFAATLDTSGNLQWNSFLGGTGDDPGTGVAVDGSGTVYVVGSSTASWGSPVQSFTTSADAYAAKLDDSGNLLWNSFLGGAGTELGLGVAADASGNVFVVGSGTATWGSPLRAYSGMDDGFGAKLDDDGNLVWSTFFGSSEQDLAHDVATDDGGDVYFVGESNDTWGSPVQPQANVGTYDAFAVKMADTRALTLALAGDGSGSVTIAPLGIGCTADCDQRISFDETLYLPALPSSGDLFAGWSGDADCSDGIVTLSEDLSCTATFTEQVVCPPTAAQIVGLRAEVDAGGRVHVEWETASEASVAGFRVHRAPRKSGPYEPISPLLPSSGDAATGARYRWLDLPGVGRFFYPLEVERHEDAPSMVGCGSTRCACTCLRCSGGRGRSTKDRLERGCRHT